MADAMLEARNEGRTYRRVEVIRAECVIADRRVNAGGDSTPADHAPRVRLIHRLLG
jgi:hypothetical protein